MIKVPRNPFDLLKHDDRAQYLAPFNGSNGTLVPSLTAVRSISPGEWVGVTTLGGTVKGITVIRDDMPNGLNSCATWLVEA